MESAHGDRGRAAGRRAGHHARHRTAPSAVHDRVADIDRACRADADLFAKVLRQHDNIGRMLSGHVHRAVTTNFAGITATTCPSTWCSLVLELRPHASPGPERSQELGLLHLVAADGVMTHVVPIPARSVG